MLLRLEGVFGDALGAGRTDLAVAIVRGLRGLEPDERLAADERQRLADFLAQLAFLSRLDRDMHLPLAQVAVDGVAGDELALQAQPFDGDVPDALCVGGADQRLQFVLPTGDARDRLRAAASRSAPADAVRLEQYDAVAAFSQV